MSQGKTYYTAYFLGEEIRTPLEMTTPAPESAEPTPEAETTPEPTTEPTEEPAPTEAPKNDGGSNNYLAWLAVIPLMALSAGGAVYFMKRRENHNAKTIHPVSDVDDDSGGGSPDAGC